MVRRPGCWSCRIPASRPRWLSAAPVAAALVAAALVVAAATTALPADGRDEPASRQDRPVLVPLDIRPPDPTVAPSPAPDPAPRRGRLLGAESDPRALAALDLIPYPWRELGFDIVWLGPRDGWRALIRPAQGRIEVYARPGEPVESLAVDIAHEIGHAVDVVHGTGAGRARWRELRGIPPGLPWFGCSGCPDLATPAGDYAEVFAYDLLRQAPQFRSRLGSLPGDTELERLRPLLRP